MSKIKIILVLFLIQGTLCAQENETTPVPDNLMNKLKLAKNNEDSISIYIEISDYYRPISTKKRLDFGLIANKISNTKNKELQALLNLTLAKGYFNFNNVEKLEQHLKLAYDFYSIDTSLNAKKKLLEIYDLWGFSHYLRKEYKKAIESYLNAEKIITELKDTSKIVAEIHFYLANSYTAVFINEKALKLYQKALFLFSKAKDTNQIALVYNSLGLIYSKQNKHEEAIKYYREYLKHSIALKKNSDIALAYNNLGFKFALLNKYDSSEIYLKKSIQISKKNKDTLYLPNTYHSLGAMYSKSGDLKSAFRYLTLAESLSLSSDFELTCYIHTDIADVLQKEKKNKQALIRLKKAEKIAIKHKQKYAYLKILALYSKIYSKMGEYQKAINYQKINLEEKNSLYNESIDRDLTNMNIRYTVQKLENKIQHLEKITQIQEKDVSKELQFNRYLSSASFLVIILIVLFFFMRILNKKYRKVLKKKNKQLEQNKAALQLMNNELIDINTSKDRLFNLIAYNLKKPFLILLDYSQLIIENYDSLTKNEIIKYNEQINFTAQNLFELLENLLYWSRFEIGTIDVNIREYSLNEFIDDNLSWFKNKVNLKGILLSTNLSEDLPVKFDKNLISMVVRNLISNAIEETEKNGIVKVSTLKHNNSIEISIEDSNKKIKDILSLKKISNNSIKGLGLLVSNKIIQLHSSELILLTKKQIGSRISFKLKLE